MKTPDYNQSTVLHLRRLSASVAKISSLVLRVLEEANDRRKAQGRQRGYETIVMSVHAHRIADHAVALAERIENLGTVSTGRVLGLSSGHRILDMPGVEKVVETKDAYDDARLDSLNYRDIRDAIEFNTERKDMFGLATLDEELDEPLQDFLHVLAEQMNEDDVPVPVGTAVKALKRLLKGHPSAFARYFTGVDPWPRPSAIIQAEIDVRMPNALEWLRYELEEALEQENAAAKSADDAEASEELPSLAVGSETEEPAGEYAHVRFTVRRLQGGDVDESLYDDRGRRVDVEESFFDDRGPKGYLPIEADEEHRERIDADRTIDPLHLESLDDLKRMLSSDEEKNRVFCNSLDDTGLGILHLLTEVAVREIEGRCSTVVGVANKLIQVALDIRAAESQKLLDRLIL